MRYVQEKYLDANFLKVAYKKNKPFPHIVLDDFIESEFLNKVLDEFPDLSTIENKRSFNEPKQIKFGSIGFENLSESAFELISFLNSDIFLKYLQKITGIKEPLISDPYLSGGGYHEIKNGGVLKVHADFNRHPSLDLDRRVNLLLYLNKNWKEEWGGNLELYSQDDLEKPVVKVTPEFNRCVIFNTTSYTYHGHPEIVSCPEGVSRKSIALYYFSTGRPKSEISEKHSTMWKEVKGETFKPDPLTLGKIIKKVTPPIIFDFVKLMAHKLKWPG